MLESFFNHLSNRFYKENALSDITWAMCMSSEIFKVNFMKFFFDEDNFIQLEIIREYSKGNSRPDFWIKTESNEYLIEVKIHDKNHHFEQYDYDFPNAKKGYIANYQIENIEGYSIKNWREFIDWFKNEVLKGHENIPEKDLLLINGYFSYLTSVCSIINYEKMNLSNLKSLYHFNLMINEIIKTPFIESELYCTVNTLLKGINEYRSGKYFTIFKGDTHLVIGDPWFGVCYETGKVFIEIYPFNHPKSAFMFFDTALKENRLQKGNYFDKPIKKDGSIWFNIIEEKFTIFNSNTTSIETQKEILTNFFNEAIRYIREIMEE